MDENIQYPHSIGTDVISAVSLANSRIIITSQFTNYSLFSFETDGWTETFFDLPKEISSVKISNEQLLTLKGLESGR